MSQVSQIGQLVMFVSAALLAAPGDCSSERLHGGGITLSTSQLWKPTFFLVYLSLFSNQVLPLSTHHLLPYGSSNSDTLLASTNDGSSTAQIISPPFPFYDNSYTDLFVNANGFLSFVHSSSDYDPYHFPNSNKMIAPYWSDADATRCGNIWYRQTTDAGVIAQATSHIQNAHPSYSGFIGAWAFIATWDAVCFYGATVVGLNQQNTFQVALVRDASATNSFFIMNYEQLEWTTGTDGGGHEETGLGGNQAVAGANDGTNFFEIPLSQTPDVLTLTQTTNAGFPGRWICKISSAQPGPPFLSSNGVVIGSSMDVTLTFTSAACGVVETYTVLRNGAAISTGTGDTFLVTAAGSGAGDYTCIVTVNGQDSPQSNVITIVDQPDPPTLSSDGVHITIYEDVTLTCTSPGGGVNTYTFLHNGAVVYSGTLGDTYIVTTAGSGEGVYTCTVTVNGQSSPPSNDITIVENFACPPAGFYFADRNNMCKFYQCDNHGNHFHMTCGPGTKWAQHITACTHLGVRETCP